MCTCKFTAILLVTTSVTDSDGSHLSIFIHRWTVVYRHDIITIADSFHVESQWMSHLHLIAVL